MAYHSDPTANIALGSVNREWQRMVHLAVRIRRNPEMASAEAERRFTGIYRRLLTDPLAEVEAELHGKGR
ncbi:MAG: hypothetical protein IJ083_04185 [Clostridia bacterium]|nr:hypothetical protein [Clostridia bacterium]